MWIREELKIRGKSCFMKNYWPAVAVVVILLIAGGDLFKINVNITDIKDSIENIGHAGHGGIGVRNMLFGNLFGVFMAGIASIFGIIGILFSIFVKNVLEVGSNRFFMENRERRVDIISILYGFKNGGYGNIVTAMFLRNLFIRLWTLLFIVPGIIKSYEYRMVAYILSENPNMPYQRAFELSRQMMDGQKMDAFVLDLSFIGWHILSGLTCGMLGIFYVEPYYQATNAELYAVLRAHAFYTGALTSMELPGYGDADYDYIRR